MNKLAVLFLMAFSSTLAASESDSDKKLTLKDLSSFKSQTGNWLIVGDVSIDPNVGTQSSTGKYDPRSKRGIETSPGAGVLFNNFDENHKDHLVTTWQHGDVDLELDVMLPKGSDSGIYFQGRYELQLSDSFGVKNPRFSDMGGINRNWHKEQEEVYVGKAPLINAAKAPGLWQHLKIAFRAPKFDRKGNKIANAYFAKVELNGVLVQSNVEVGNHTGDPINHKETRKGPLVIQGDRGAVALRNIEVRHISEPGISLSKLTYRLHKGNFKTFEDFQSREPDKRGSAKLLSVSMMDSEEGYGLSYAGKLKVARADDYRFVLDFNGGARLRIDGKELAALNSPRGDNRRLRGNLKLNKGTHLIELDYFKKAKWSTPKLGLMVQGSSTHAKVLNDLVSNPARGEKRGPIYVSVGAEPKLLRGFVDYHRGEHERLTHTIGVGDPAGIHYAYDLEVGSLAAVWKGEFVNATPMWNNRGNGSFQPMGMLQYLDNGPALARLADQNTPFPSEQSARTYRSRGYVIDQSSRRPVFKYEVEGLEVFDKIYPDTLKTGFTREISVQNKDRGDRLFFKLGEGADIVALPNNLYAIDDHRYYIQVASATKPTVRRIGGHQELIVDLASDDLTYSVIW